MKHAALTFFSLLGLGLSSSAMAVTIEMANITVGAGSATDGRGTFANLQALISTGTCFAAIGGVNNGPCPEIFHLDNVTINTVGNSFVFNAGNSPSFAAASAFFLNSINDVISNIAISNAVPNTPLGRGSIQYGVLADIPGATITDFTVRILSACFSSAQNCGQNGGLSFAVTYNLAVNGTAATTPEPSTSLLTAGPLALLVGLRYHLKRRSYGVYQGRASND